MHGRLQPETQSTGKMHTSILIATKNRRGLREKTQLAASSGCDIIKVMHRAAQKE
jgi:hypothetical protein